MRAMQALNQIHNCIGIMFVQISGRFIREQQRRIVDQRPRNRHALLLSPGQLRSLMLRPRRQPYFAKPFRRPSSAPRHNPTLRMSKGMATFSTAVKSDSR